MQRRLDQILREHERNSHRYGFQYLMTREPETYFCESGGIGAQQIIDHIEEKARYEESKFQEFIAARNRSPPATQEELRQIERDFTRGILSRVMDHFFDCDPCQRFADMYEGYIRHFRGDLPGIQKKFADQGIADPPKNRVEFGQLFHDALRALDIDVPMYRDFDHYWQETQVMNSRAPRLVAFSPKA